MDGLWGLSLELLLPGVKLFRIRLLKGEGFAVGMGGGATEASGASAVLAGFSS